MNTTLFEKYAEVTKEIKRLEEQKEQLATEVFTHLKDQNLDKYQSEVGTFSVYQKSSYKYSPEVETTSNALKKLKKLEEEQGIAQKEITEHLRYQA